MVVRDESGTRSDVDGAETGYRAGKVLEESAANYWAFRIPDYAEIMVSDPSHWVIEFWGPMWCPRAPPWRRGSRGAEGRLQPRPAEGPELRDGPRGRQYCLMLKDAWRMPSSFYMATAKTMRERHPSLRD